MRLIGTALVSLGLVVAGLGAPPAQAAPVTVVTQTVPELLASVPVVKPLYIGYQAGSFLPVGALFKKDKGGCTLRNRLLIKAAVKTPKVGKACKLSGGSWLVNGGSKTVTDPRQITMRPVVDYKAAWGQGAYAWTPAQRYAWATNILKPAGPTRARGVNYLQGTQQLYFTPDVNSIIRDVKLGIFARMIAEMSDGSPMGYFMAALALDSTFSRGGDVFSQLILQGLAEVGTSAKACPAFAPAVGSLLTNMESWGLSIDNGTYQSLRTVTDTCLDLGSWTYELLSSIYGINRVTSTQVVPNASGAMVPPATGSTSTFTGYGAPVSAAVSRNLFGLHAPPDSGLVPSVPYGYLRLWDSAVSWADVEPSKGSYNWTKLDAAVASAQRQGVSMMYVLGNTPAWAGNGSGASAPNNISDVSALIGAMCTRYQGSIASYEAWNEGNLQTFWTGTQEQLADVTKAVYDAVKGCFPASNVIASSTGTRAEGAFATNFAAYLRALGSKGWPVDGYAVHSYPSAAGGPTSRLDGLSQFKTMLAVTGAPAKPIYDTELNYGLAGLGLGHVDLDESTSMAYLSRSYIDSVRYGVDSTFWFLWTGGYQDKLGIQLHPGTTATQVAWTTTYNWLIGSRMQRCGEFGTVTVCQSTAADGSNFSLIWASTGTASVATTGLGSTVCNLRSSCSPITGAAITVGIEPVRVN